jgi:hypothetical protein
MNIRTNGQMSKHLLALGYDFLKIHVELPEELEKISRLEFLTGNDCTLLQGLYGHQMTPEFETDIQKCEWEYSENHFHPDEYARTQNEGEFLILALECAKRIAFRLKENFTGKNFRLIISYDETVIEEGETETYGSSTVRFHELRKDCKDFYGFDSLEKFEQDAVMVIDI